MSSFTRPSPFVFRAASFLILREQNPTRRSIQRLGTLEVARKIDMVIRVRVLRLLFSYVRRKHVEHTEPPRKVVATREH